MVTGDAHGYDAWRPDRGLLDGLTIAALVVDSTGTLAYANPAAAALFGAAGAPIGEDVQPAALAAPEGSGFDEVLRVVLDGARWSGELSMVMGGTQQVMATSWSPLTAQDGAVVSALVLAEHTAGPGSRVGMLTGRLGRLAAVTRELLVADGLEAVTKIVTERVTEAAAATVGSLSLLVDDETLALVGLHGARDGVASRWATYPVAANTPVGEAVRTRRTLVVGRAEIERRFPEVAQDTEGASWLVCLPLRIRDRPVGVMSLSFPGRRPIDAAELEFFGLLADISAQAIDRLQALAEAADHEAKLRFLATASAELAATLDYEATLQQVARLAVPWFAEWCAIGLEQDGWLRTVAVAHVDPAKVALAEDLNRRYPPDPQAPRGAYSVLRSGRSDLVPEVPDEILVAAAQDEDHLRTLRLLGFRSALQVPLRARDRVLGVITWVTGDQGRRFSSKDLAFAEDLAARAAVAIDNAQLHTELRDVAVRLQRAVLPEQLPELPDWEMAVRYLPAGRTEVSGDFYEVVPLGDGRLVVFVGDVMGRGVQAAAAMAQMRAAVRALVAVDPEPPAVLDGLDRLFERFDLEQLVTLVYIVVDPANEQLQLLNAGHPCPLVLRASGDVADMSTTDTMILGAGGGQRSVLTRTFRDGDALLAFTDGLVERRGEDIDAGVRRLAQAFGAMSGTSLDDALGALVDQVRDQTRDDDVAVLAVRHNPLR